MVFKFAYFVELTEGYQPAKFQCCRLTGSSFTEGLQKQNDDVISPGQNPPITFYIQNPLPSNSKHFSSESVPRPV